MDPVQTLHDFTLSLIGDPHARSAFQADPQGSLDAAGLGDLTALDVREVLPLVLDYAPTGGLDPALTGVDVEDLLELLGDSPIPVGEDLLGHGLDDNTATAAVSGVAAAAQHLAGDVTGDLAGSLDADVLNRVEDITATGRVADVVGDVTSGVATGDVLGTTHLTGSVEDITGKLHVGDVLSDNVTDNLTGNALDLHDIAQVGDIGDIADVGDVANVGQVVGDVANVGDVTGGIGDLTGIGKVTDVADLHHVDLGGVLSGNEI
ncbi:IniB N-terminal domain-containing protein, partial [Saccharothrix sp. Mg75]|uniref:IniB N-terminal domain-containing protein n=1 Tax=Saccharothrix sp. Mg75 TaxID=3445357 RepID=UPI003EE84950